MADLNCIFPASASAVVQTMAEAAEQAGDLLLRTLAGVDRLTVTEKTAGDFVSEADMQAETILKEVLLTSYSDFGWLGEETAGNPIDGLRWIVDPLDGTTNFLKRLPHWAISIALADGPRVVAGLIFDPVKRECFVAEANKGAFLNGRSIHVSSNASLSSALFATGVPNGARVTYLPECLAEMARLMPDCAGVRRSGAAALDLAYVAAGRFDGYWERNLGAWDVAAGMLLVAEAGGSVEPLWDGTTVLDTGSFIATNGRLQSVLRGYLETNRK